MLVFASVLLCCLLMSGDAVLLVLLSLLGVGFPGLVKKMAKKL